MRTFFVLFAHPLVAIAQLMKPGGARAIVAENLLLKQQLLVACRTRQRYDAQKHYIPFNG